jgi:hypothetical protein
MPTFRKRNATVAPLYCIGETVCWSSQSNGRIKEKTGIIEAIIPVGHQPSEQLYPELYRGAGIGRPRDHMSYVVRVGKRAYWPRAKSLAPAKATKP